jgi:predicted phosphate transport protein (TIGR00153 family)
LIPKEEKFFELFETQASYNVQAAKLFKELADDWKMDSDVFEKLRDLEHEADFTTHEVVDRLNRTFVTPFDRTDIHRLAGQLDDIVDIIESMTSRMKLVRIRTSTSYLARLADTLWQATENLRKAIVALRSPEKGRRVLDYCIEVNRLENEGDRILDDAIGELFADTHDLLEIFKWKEIYESIERAIDKCEDVANSIESIVVKRG